MQQADAQQEHPRCKHCGSGDLGAVEVRGVYDGALFLECLTCGGTQHRWDEYGSPRLYQAAQPFVHGPVAKEKEVEDVAGAVAK